MKFIKWAIIIGLIVYAVDMARAVTTEKAQDKPLSVSTVSREQLDSVGNRKVSDLSKISTKSGAKDSKTDKKTTADKTEKDGEKTSKKITKLPTVMVIAATRNEEEASKTASSVTVMDRGQIEATHLPSVASALSTFPGIAVVPNGAPGQVTSVFTRGTESNHTLLTIDGRRQSPDLAGLYDYTNMSLDNVERIEDVRTANSTMQGGNSIGGTINIVTKSGKGLAKPESSVLFEGGSYGTFREVAASRGAIGLFDYSIESTRLDTDNQRMNNQYRNTSGRANFGFTIDETMYVDTLLTYNNSDTGVPNSIYFRDNIANLTRELWSVSPRFTWKPTKFWKSVIYMTHDQQRQYYTDMFGTRNRLQINTNTIDWQNTFEVVPEWTLTAGTTFWDSEIWQRNSTGERNIQASQSSIGGFVQSQWTPVEDLNIITSGRFDHYTDYLSSFSWRQGASYRTPCTRTLFHGSVSSSYAPPTFQDLYFPFFSNPNLKPESSIGWEAGVEQPFLNNKLIASATYFFNNIKDFIQFTGSSPKNIARAETQGAEFTLSYKPIEEFEMRANYTYTFTEDMRTKLRLLRRPEHMMNFDLIGRPVKFITLALGGSWMVNREDSSARTFARIDQEDYFTVRASATWQANEHVQLWVRGENVLNEQYEPVNGYPALDAGVYGGVKVMF